MGEEFFVYHVVTERPMQLGQIIVFDEHHHNGVYERIMTCKKILDGENVHNDLAYMIRSDLNRWSATTYRELSLEKVRQEEFDNYPSRLACLYTSQQLNEAEATTLKESEDSIVEFDVTVDKYIRMFSE